MDTKEPQDSSNNVEVENEVSKQTTVNRAISFLSNNIKAIGIALLVIIVLKMLFSSPAQTTTATKAKPGDEVAAENLIQQSEESAKTEKLSKLQSVQDDFQAAVAFLKDIFSKNGYDTSVFRLSDVYAYNITPAQEANGLEDAKRLAVRFAFKHSKSVKVIE